MFLSDTVEEIQPKARASTILLKVSVNYYLYDFRESASYFKGQNNQAEKHTYENTSSINLICFPDMGLKRFIET